jgi:hypothetical protein
MTNFAFRDSSTFLVHTFTVNADSFRSSVHGKVHCQQCHADIREYPHTFKPMYAKVSCGTDCHVTDSTGRAYTHEKVFTEFQQSSHRKGLTGENHDDPTCTTCHGSGNPHKVQKALKTISSKEKMLLCISCHQNKEVMIKNKVDPDAVTSYEQSFHYKAIKFGGIRTAVCQDCHTVHRILPKDSTQSSIAVGNIAKTCGQEQCHPGAQMNFSMSGANHLALRVEREPILYAEEKFFVLLTVGTMAMLVIGIVLDVQKKFGWMLVFERLIRRLRGGLDAASELLKALGRISRKVLIE